jgi:hypothetical protein
MLRMDVLSSAEFRKQYAKLTEPTTVTVNGHVIGTWMPYVNHHPMITNPEALPEVMDALAREVTSERYDIRPRGTRPFSSRPFTPVPKRGK